MPSHIARAGRDARPRSTTFTFSNLPAVGWKLSARDIATMAQRCESVGFDRFAVADLPFHYDCIAVMAACLLRTERIAVESLVTNAFTRDVALTAAAFATLADLSGGRAILGIGGGVEAPKKVWVAPWGHDRPHAVEAVREAVGVARALWRGERVTFDGKVVHVHDVALDCPLPPPIRVLIAARGPRMLRLAGEVADVVHLATLFLGPEHRAAELALVSEGARRAGRAPGSYEIDVSVTVSASRDRERARRAARRNAAQSILWYAGADQYGREREWSRPRGYRVPGNVIETLAARWDMWADPELPPDVEALISDDLLDQFTVWGEPERCAERLREIVAAFPDITGVRVKLPLPTRSGTLSGFLDDVEALGEVLAAYRAPVRPSVSVVL